MKGIDLSYFDGFKGMVADRTVSAGRMTTGIYNCLKHTQGVVRDIDMDIIAEYMGLREPHNNKGYLGEKERLMKRQRMSMLRKKVRDMDRRSAR